MASKQVICTRTHFLTNLLLTIIILLTCSSAPFNMASGFLVPHSTPAHLHYHKGPLLAGDGPIKLFLTFYGHFTPLEKNTVTSFLNSLSDSEINTPKYPHIAHDQTSNSLHELHKSVRLSDLRSVSEERGVELIVGRRGLPSSVRASGYSSFKLKASGSSSAELEAGPSSSEIKASGSSSPSELKASGSSSSSSELEASGFSSSSALELARGSSPASSALVEASGSPPTVANWWSLTRAYTDLRGNPVSQTLQIEHAASDDYSLGKLLSRSDIASLAKRSARAAFHDELSVHIILTAADVRVEGFCMHACGRHAHTQADGELNNHRVVYAWVGNSREQCPGYCSWPFVRTKYGPPDMEPLRAPNSASADGMIINLAKVLVEAATNPYGNGYHLGVDAHVSGVGVGGVCTGVFGKGAFPGYQGRTFEDALTRASFNVMGIHQSKFLLPYIWNPLTLSCAVHP